MTSDDSVPFSASATASTVDVALSTRNTRTEGTAEDVDDADDADETEEKKWFPTTSANSGSGVAVDRRNVVIEVGGAGEEGDDEVREDDELEDELEGDEEEEEGEAEEEGGGSRTAKTWTITC